MANVAGPSTLAVVFLAQFGLLATYNQLTATTPVAVTTTSTTSDALRVPVCPPCPAVGYSPFAFWSCIVAAFLAGVGLISLVGVVASVFWPGVFAFAAGAALKDSLKEETALKVAPYRKRADPGDSESD